MRFKIDGRVNGKRLVQIAETITRMLSEYGVNEMRAVNVYLIPVDPETNGDPELLNSDDEPLEEIVIGQSEPVQLRPRKRRSGMSPKQAS